MLSINNIDIPSDLSTQSCRSLERYGYRLQSPLNNRNRWASKIVYSVLGRDSRRYVSTAYAGEDDYLRLIGTTNLLKRNKKISPKIVNLYPQDRIIVCDYIGEFLLDYLLNNPGVVYSSLSSVFKYLKEVNSINKNHEKFITPPIIQSSLQLSEGLVYGFEFLSSVKAILPKLENSGLKFIYGYGIEDPHIWNFRIIKTQDKIEAFTTDFDYFLNKANCFWELGYFYATFRWVKKTCSSIAQCAEEIIISLMENYDLKSEFMFWLGALSSYCGYKDSLCNLIVNGGNEDLSQQYNIIQRLDERVSSLANRLLCECND